MSEVGEDGDIKGNAEGAKFYESMRSGLEDEVLGASIFDDGNAMIECEDVWGGHVGGSVVKHG